MEIWHTRGPRPARSRPARTGSHGFRQEDRSVREGSASFLYETLDPFFSADPDRAADPTKSYAVFRNQITSPSDSLADFPAADYFSLDVAADSLRREKSPPPQRTPGSRALEGNRALEQAWFHAGSRFKSPMLHLHKGKRRMSDRKVVILESNVKTPQMGLHALARALSQGSIVKKMQVIAKARVPIVKFVEKRSGISFDIRFKLSLEILSDKELAS
ncbi:hypothetical protein COCNU_scaffold011959G000050 [Cocos nucifera]|nr:hypothetical protein [Cocos nucifera]